MTDIRAGIPAIEAQYGQTVVAVAVNDDGTVYDHAFTWETGQALALEGYRMVATADDGHMPRERAQALYDADRARYRDCFGIEPMPDPSHGIDSESDS